MTKDISPTSQMYIWMSTTGIDLATFEPERVVECTKEEIRSFKDNPKETKRKYNYKFQFKRDILNGIFDLINVIEKLKFEHKN